MALDINDLNSAKQEQQITDRFLSRFRGGEKAGALMSLVSDAVSGMLDRKPVQQAPRAAIPSAANASAMGADRTMQFMQMQQQAAQAQANRQLEAERIRAQEEAAERARQQQLKLEQLRMKNQIDMEKFRIETQQKLRELEIQREKQAEERKRLEPFELEDGHIVQRGENGVIKPVYQSPLYQQRIATSKAQQIAAQLRAAAGGGRGGTGGASGGRNVSLQDRDVVERVWNPETLAFDTITRRVAFDPRANIEVPVTDAQGRPVVVVNPGTPNFVRVKENDGSERMYPTGPDGKPIRSRPVTAEQLRAAGKDVPSPIRADAVLGDVETGFTVAPAPQDNKKEDFSQLQAAVIDGLAWENMPEYVKRAYTVNEDGIPVDAYGAFAPPDVLKLFNEKVEAAKAGALGQNAGLSAPNHHLRLTRLPDGRMIATLYPNRINPE